MSSSILDWLVCGLLVALGAASWALAESYGLCRTLLELYCLVHPTTPLRHQRARARRLRDFYRLATPLCVVTSVVWAGVALRWW